MSIYYNPESVGLTIVDSVNLTNDYDFHMFVVWKNKKGDLFWAEDSGCSCPSPFENYHDVASLEPLKSKKAFKYFEECVLGQSEYNRTGEDLKAFIENVRKEFVIRYPKKVE